MWSYINYVIYARQTNAKHESSRGPVARAILTNGAILFISSQAV